MSCRAYRLLISASIDGRPDEDLGLQAHLELCDSCRAFEKDLRVMARWIDSVEEDLEPPDRIWQGIESRIQAPACGKQGRAFEWRRYIRLPRWDWQYSFAALLVLMVCSLLLWQGGGRYQMQSALAELESYQIEVRENPWESDRAAGDNPFHRALPSKSRHPFGDFKEGS